MLTKTLDQILALQFTVAWAGEALSDPPRLGWWRTDLIDEAGGADLLARLAPRTHRWAALEAVKHAAVLADRKARQRIADPDSVRTLYFWGFELDEQLSERTRELKWSQTPPPVSFSQFNKARLEADLRADAPYSIQSSGRELRGVMPADRAQAAKLVAAALLPFPDEYPAPFFRV